jgi:hypothetical protein
VAAIFCDNKQNIHEGMYCRYLFLIDEHGAYVTIDDPSEAYVEETFRKVNAKHVAVTAPCPWCLSLIEDS